MDQGMRNNVLKKIIEFIQSLPEAEESEGGEMGEMMEKPEGKLEIMAVQAKPKGEDDDDMMKGC